MMMRNLRLSPPMRMRLDKSSGSSGSLMFFLLLMVLAFFSTSSEAKRSACWRYGHSCWGGHGKRSGVNGVSPLTLSSSKRNTLLGGTIIPAKIISKLLLRHNGELNVKTAPNPQNIQHLLLLNNNHHNQHDQTQGLSNNNPNNPVRTFGYIENQKHNQAKRESSDYSYYNDEDLGTSGENKDLKDPSLSPAAESDTSSDKIFFRDRKPMYMDVDFTPSGTEQERTPSRLFEPYPYSGSSRILTNSYNNPL